MRNTGDSCFCSVCKSCLTLCDPMDCSPQGFSVHGIFQARILEWVAISFSRRFSQPWNGTCVSCVSCSVVSDSVSPAYTHQTPRSMELSRKEYWSGLPFPSPKDLLKPGIEPGSSALQVNSLPSEPSGNPTVCL